MKSDVYVVKKLSKKEGRADFTYIQLYVDLGYRILVLPLDNAQICSLTGLQERCLYDMDYDVPMKVGEYHVKGE